MWRLGRQQARCGNLRQGRIAGGALSARNSAGGSCRFSSGCGRVPPRRWHPLRWRYGALRAPVPHLRAQQLPCSNSAHMSGSAQKDAFSAPQLAVTWPPSYFSSVTFVIENLRGLLRACVLYGIERCVGGAHLSTLVTACLGACCSHAVGRG